jgi:TIR domain-containing protein
MDLPTIEKQITTLAVRRFIESYTPTKYKEIDVQFQPRGVDAVHRLVGINVLRELDNEKLIPKVVAFSLCGRRESQLQAKSSFEMVVPFLQRLYANLPDGVQPNTSMLLNDMEVSWPGLSPSVIWLGLYQCFEMGFIGGWSWEKQDAEQTFRINRGTMSVDAATHWDKYIEKHTSAVETFLINAIARKFLQGMTELSRSHAGTGIPPLQWVELARSLGLNQDDRNVIVRYLLEGNLLVKKGASDMLALTREGLESLSPQTQAFELQESDEMTSPSESSAATTRSGVLVLISHSGKDEALASALIDLLRSALGLLPNQIRCSSVDGYRLPAGVHSDTQLREEVNASRVLIGLITPNSLASPYVLFELGARWGAGETMVPLLAGVSPNELRGPLSGFNALLCSSEAQLHQAMGEIGEHLDLEAQRPEAYLKQLRSVIDEVGKFS